MNCTDRPQIMLVTAQIVLLPALYSDELIGMPYWLLIYCRVSLSKYSWVKDARL